MSVEQGILKMEEKNIIEIKNKRAAYEYFLMDEYQAGLVLMGSEIKSIREGKANLSDAWCTFIGNELFVRDMHISEYKFGSYWGHTAKRDRKLLSTVANCANCRTASRSAAIQSYPYCYT